MILIADSGSTKTDWRLLLPDGEIAQATTVGFNPNYQSAENIRTELQESLLPQLGNNQPTQIYFYGAGCSTEAKCSLVADAILNVFPGSHVQVMSDVVAAARGTCGHQAGIACILGTGSNSCLYNGEIITAQMPCLGFTLGNEGSGSYLGKKLLHLYLNHELPADLQEAFGKQYPATQAEILHRIYNEPFPNRYVASFALFLQGRQRHPFVAELLHQNFLDFFRLTVCKYPDYQMLPTHFVGSIAFYFADILRKTAKSQHIQVGRILQSPIAGLALYH
ncbi:ATPase [Adhaeribacter aerolatus]|uniref:ATPase n=1 Tax=Adhaeribacter aerolatus TaxID=670289 RepID=A0A512ATE2_9BACT|nr:N-acetylglucosamine kinase [Adhaeribacter aerolatus]GEO02985.1 ATPase [Adhaeribacter aerolatus]